MDYEEKKKELLKETEEILDVYDTFYNQVMNLTSKLNNMFLDTNATLDQQLDWIDEASNNEKIQKFKRIITTCQYVQTPLEEEVIRTLKNDISVNEKHKVITNVKKDR